MSTEVYEGMPEGEAVNTLTLTEQDGRTTLTILVQHTCQEHRDAHINSGMESGLQEAMDLVEQVAVSLVYRLRDRNSAPNSPLRCAQHRDSVPNGSGGRLKGQRARRCPMVHVSWPVRTGCGCSPLG